MGSTKGTPKDAGGGAVGTASATGPRSWVASCAWAILVSQIAGLHLVFAPRANAQGTYARAAGLMSHFDPAAGRRQPTIFPTSNHQSDLVIVPTHRGQSIFMTHWPGSVGLLTQNARSNQLPQPVG